MKAELRAYILVVGRDKNGVPVRKVAKYTGAPLAGLTDKYGQMAAGTLVALESSLRAEQAKIDLALKDIMAEKYDRLQAIDTHGRIEELMK